MTTTCKECGVGLTASHDGCRCRTCCPELARQEERARSLLKARIAGNVASGPVASGDFVSGQAGVFTRVVLSADEVADRSCAVAEAILARCGL